MRGVVFVIAFGAWLTVYGIAAPTAEETARLTVDIVRKSPEYGLGKRILLDAHLRAALTGLGAGVLVGGLVYLFDGKRRPGKKNKPLQFGGVTSRLTKARCRGDARLG